MKNELDSSKKQIESNIFFEKIILLFQSLFRSRLFTKNTHKSYKRHITGYIAQRRGKMLVWWTENGSVFFATKSFREIERNVQPLSRLSSRSSSDRRMKYSVILKKLPHRTKKSPRSRTVLSRIKLTRRELVIWISRLSDEGRDIKMSSVSIKSARCSLPKIGVAKYFTLRLVGGCFAPV